MSQVVFIFIAVTLSSFLSRAEQVCGQEVKVLSASGTVKDSSGDPRQGVIAARKDSLELALTTMLISVAKMEETKSQNKDFNPSDKDMQEYQRLATGMYFCTSSSQPISGNILEFTEATKNLNCEKINNVVGLRLSAQIWTEGAAVSVTSIDVNKEVQQAFVEPKALSNNQPLDICFEKPEDITVVTVYGTSTNKEGSRGNLMVDFLAAPMTKLQQQP
jgi:hypothetical protein